MTRYLFILFLFFQSAIYGQNLSFGIAYQYQKAFEWEKMINNYNTNSPWLVKNQPYLNGSVNADAQFVFGSKNVAHHGVAFRYNWSRSYADNVDSTNKIDQHRIDIGYVLHLHDAEKLKNFFFDFGFNFSYTILKRQIEYTTLLKLSSPSSTAGIGGNFDFKFGYKVPFGSNAYFLPYIGAGYTFSQIGDLHIIFQTDGLSYINTHLVYAKVGVQFEFNLKRDRKKTKKEKIKKDDRETGFEY